MSRYTPYAIILLLLCYSCCIFASNAGWINWNDQYPWYFNNNEIKLVWKRYGKGKGVLVDVLDSKISFVSLLKDKESFSESYIGKGRKATSSELEHGTMMASLIAANLERLKCSDDYAKSEYCSKTRDKKIPIAGIAPQVKLISRETVPKDPKIKSSIFLKAIDEATEVGRLAVKNKHKMKIRPDREDVREVELIFLNVSGGDKRPSESLLHEYWDFIEESQNNNPYFLIMAAVGNEPINLNENNDSMPLPARLRKPRTPGKRDPLIRVSCVDAYKPENPNLNICEPEEEPKMGDRGSYGDKYVDILAPGYEIPVMLPNGEASVVGGSSSAATAIISATAALLASCNPTAIADSIRGAILSNADEFDNLKDKVAGGKVLNVKKAMNKFCLRKPVTTAAENNGQSSVPTPTEQSQELKDEVRVDL